MNKIWVESMFIALLFIDTRLTIDFTERLQLKESNPILGENPNRSTMNAVFLIIGLAHVLISDFLPHRYREVWQITTITVEFGAVSQSLAVGAKLRF